MSDFPNDTFSGPVAKPPSSVPASQTYHQSGEPYDVYAVREDFPILNLRVYDKPLVYLDNAATTQKPRSVIEAVQRFYETENANIHRGVHYLSEKATSLYEGARKKVQKFINARSWREVIFTRGATDGINLVAQILSRQLIDAGDEIVISALEHHSNIVPWQLICEERGAKLRVVPIDDSGHFLFEEYLKLLNSRTKLVAVTQLSNALGTITPIKEIIAAAHARGVLVLVDGAQGAAHLETDVQSLDCDFYVFSSHKIYGPTGVGVLYGKASLLEQLPPAQGGGDMIRQVTFEKSTYNAIPYKFEAGTPHIDGVIGFGAALDYLAHLGPSPIAAHEEGLLEHATDLLSRVPGLRIIGTARPKTSILSFVMDGVHPHDIGTILDREGVAIRAGHHCAQPLLARLGVQATARASFGLYNTHEEVEILARAVRRVQEVFGHA